MPESSLAPVLQVDESGSSTVSTPQTSPNERNQNRQPRHRHDTFPSVQLDSSIKQKLLSRRWNIPLFDGGNECKVKMCNVTTMCQDKDFYSAHKACNAKTTTGVNKLGFTNVLNTDVDRFVTKPDRKIPRHTGQKLTLDKSSTTEDLLLVTYSECINFLKGCFPDVSDSNLKDILDHCDGDTQWAMDLLLESYEGFECDLVDDTFPETELSAVPCLVSLAYSKLGRTTTDIGIIERVVDMCRERSNFIKDFLNSKKTTKSKSNKSKGRKSKTPEPTKTSQTKVPSTKVCAEDIVIQLDYITAQQLSGLFGEVSKTDGELIELIKYIMVKHDLSQ